MRQHGTNISLNPQGDLVQRFDLNVVFSFVENQGKCGSEQSRKRDEIANSFPHDN